MLLEKKNLSNLKQDDVFGISEFVVKENFKHHMNSIIPGDYQAEVDSIYKEEMDYLKSSKIFAGKSNDKSVLGTIRILKWDFISPLPIQKIFGINPLLCLDGRSVNEIWHIGRFAIKKGVRNINLLKKLMVCAIEPTCQHEDNFAFAECDAKLLRVLKIMGIKAQRVGDSIHYLGSETIPVCFPYSALINFYNENKHLI